MLSENRANVRGIYTQTGLQLYAMSGNVSVKCNHDRRELLYVSCARDVFRGEIWS